MMKMASLMDYQQYAQDYLPKRLYSQLEDGAGDQVTKQANQEDFVRIKMKQRGMANMKYFKGPQTTILNGSPVSTPIGLGPLPMQGLYCYEGEVAAAQAARDLKIVYTLHSARSSKPIDEILAKSEGGYKLLMVSLSQNNQERQQIIEKYGGHKDIIGIVINLAVECQIDSFVRSTVTNEKDIYMVKEQQAAFTLEDLKSLKKQCEGIKKPLVVRGIMNKQDALLAAQNGANAIWISNQGGKGLDTQPSAISVLKSITKTLRQQNFSNVQIFIDGGFRRGTEVMKALALGANAVFLCRPIAYALAHKGSEGIKEMFEMLNEELKLSMALTDVMDVSKITEDQVIHSFRPKL
eukprot:403332483